MASKPAPNDPLTDAETRLFRAPGRINIIGEHTDYNDGFVLPTNTALYTSVAASRRDDRVIHTDSRTLDEVGDFDLDDIERNEQPQWLAYVKGVAAELESAGANLHGANLVIEGEIPIGGGLSSSASLELAVACAFSSLANYQCEAAVLAQTCQQAEINYAGVNCGIMDQFSVACGKPGEAMLLDCQSLNASYVTLPENLSLIVTDSGVSHMHPDSGYNDRASECRAAVSALRQSGAEIDSLREASPEMLEAARSELGDLRFRRARHVVTENLRTIAAFTAIRDDDVSELGALVAGSHASLRDDYEVSCHGIEKLIGLLSQIDGVAGSRMVGGGFGGCVLSVVTREATASVVDKIRSDYGRVISGEPWVHVVEPAHAAREVSK